MDLQETPLEALVAFRYSAAAARPVLAWLAAVLTAALGLWGIRAVGSGSASRSRSGPPPDPTPRPSGATQAPVSEKPSPVAAPRVLHVEDVGTPKARFMAYFESCNVDDGDDDVDGEGEVEDERNNDESNGFSGMVQRSSTAEWWELTAVSKRRDLGWYRYQDMTALNGSVVRLWDGRDGGVTASPRTASRRVW